MPKRLPYEEGSWFLLPIAKNLYASGVVARVSPAWPNILLGYFFDELFEEMPDLGELCGRRAEDAGMVLVFGNMGLLRGEWSVIGKCDGWQAAEWPMPTFVRVNPLTDLRDEIWLDEMDPNKVIGERRMASDDMRELPRHGLSGHIAVQIMMAKRLGVAPN